MKTIYISGKITGLEWPEVLESFGKAEALLAEAGYKTFNPATHPHDHSKTWNAYMSEDIKQLLECQSIFMLKNWKDSKGARLEHAVALEIGLEIIYDGDWQPERAASKKIQHIEDYPALKEAMALNNTVKSKAAYVYDRFTAASVDCQGMNASQIIDAYADYLTKIPGEHDKPVLDLFRMVPVDTFDSNEQIDWLIKEGKFFYAPVCN